MSRVSSLFDLLGMTLPIVQAPTGTVASVDLVSEVGRAGGIGGLALTWSMPDDAVAKVRAVKARWSALLRELCPALPSFVARQGAG